MSDATSAVLNERARQILSLDGGAGFVVGVGMLVLRPWLQQLFALSPAQFGFIAAANVAYGVYAGTLAIRAWRGTAPTRLAVSVLIGANATWALVCVFLVIRVAGSASIFGLGYIVLEGLFVAFLAMTERRVVLPYT